MLERITAVLSSSRRALGLARQPWIPGRREANQRAWERLAPELRQPKQMSGRQLPGCAATHQVMERCDFSCTACYLANTANSVPPLPFEEVKAQLDAIREYLGPWGNTQITAGEVTLLPVEELIRILRYCREIELSAMVMTHGETFRKDPTYLERLVVEGGLEKVAIHIDTTQRGRRGMNNSDRERDIHWIRDEFAELIRETRRTTGRPLAASHTFTVSEQNLEGVPDVMQWMLENADAFRMISFQPTASVGRTRVGALTGEASNRDLLWERIARATGGTPNRQTLIFGHPKCTDVSLSFVVRFDDETHHVEVTRAGQGIDRRFFDRLFGGSFGGFTPDGQTWQETLARLSGRILRQPRYWAEVPAYCAYRAFTERSWLTRFLRAALRGRPVSVRPFVIVVHNFMSREELSTLEGRERLDSCVFRLPVDGRMVSMCQLNGTEMRKELNVTTRQRLAADTRSTVLPTIG